MDELKPILNEFLGQPVAFVGGLVSGFLKLESNAEEFVKSYVQKGGQ